MGWQIVTRWPIYLNLLCPLHMAAQRFRPANPSSYSLDEHFSAALRPWRAFAGRYTHEWPKLVAQREREAHVGRPAHAAHTGVSGSGATGPGIRPSPIVCLLWRMRGKREAGWPALLWYGPNGRYGWREVVLTELFLAGPDPSLGRRLLQANDATLAGGLCGG